MGKADLHVHTRHDGWGDGNDAVAEILRFVEEGSDLDLVAVTDHDSTEAARAGRALHPRGEYRFDFLPGVEVTTRSGHLLCYFLGEIVDVPSLRSLAWTSRYIHHHNGICVLAHPVYPPWLQRSLQRDDSRALRMVEAVEVINGGLSATAQVRLDRLGATLAGRCSLTGNSDSHHKESIGSVFTEFPGRSLDDFVQAVREGRTAPRRGQAVNMPGQARSFTRKRSMTRPGWVRNVYREVVRPPSRG